jgi:hypothetical protein
MLRFITEQTEKARTRGIVKSASKASLSMAGMIVLTLAGCLVAKPVQLAQEQPPSPTKETLYAQMSTPTPIIMINGPKNTPTPGITGTPHATATITTGMLLNDVKVKVLQIAGYDNQQLSLSKCVEKAFWSDDEQHIYYAFSSPCGKKPLGWAAFDIATRSTMTVASPLKYNPDIWRRLNVPEPLSSSSRYPELLGYVSPSGKHVIYTVIYGTPGPGSHDPSDRTEIWLADLSNYHKTKLFKALMGTINQVVWFNNETQVIFDFGYEGGVSLYIADVRKGTVVSLDEMSDFKGGTEQLWAVSPNGTTLAVIDSRGNLWLVSLENGKGRKIVEHDVYYPSWSKAGGRLYYYSWGSSPETQVLRYYDVTSGTINSLIHKSKLEEAGVPLGDFAVSSGGDRMVIWIGGGIWLVELHK